MEEGVLRDRVQRSDMAAETVYDFRRLEERHHLLLPCRIEEEKETVCMSFDLRGMQVLEELREADGPVKLAVLLQAADLQELYMKYEFSMEPENLYYDILGRVRVKRRDVIRHCGKDREKDFLRRYQALIGYVLDGSRPYEDYLYEGFELLNAGDDLADFLEPETVQEEKKVLTEHYENLLQEEKRYMRGAEVKKYRRLVRLYAVTVVLALIFLAVILYI